MYAVPFVRVGPREAHLNQGGGRDTGTAIVLEAQRVTWIGAKKTPHVLSRQVRIGPVKSAKPTPPTAAPHTQHNFPIVRPVNKTPYALYPVSHSTQLDQFRPVSLFFKHLH